MTEGAKPKAPAAGKAAARPRRPRKPRAATPAMAAEAVVAAADAPVGPTVDPAHPTPGDPPPPADPGKICANCATPLIGHYCHECGQQAHLHNKLGHLLHEFVEGIAHFDGRLWRTLPLLAWRPGQLSRDWIEGKRARYVAPLHIFLFALFLMFTIPSLIHYPETVVINGVEVAKSKEARDELMRQQQKALEEMKAKPGEPVKGPEKMVTGADEFIVKKMANFEYYLYKIKTLAYKLSFLIAPISMLILWLLLLYKRRFTLYDHGAVALYGLGFLALLIAVGFLMPPTIRDVWTFAWMLFVPVHAVRHLKVAYGLGWPAAVGVGLVMGVLTLFAILLFTVGVIALGLLG